MTRLPRLVKESVKDKLSEGKSISQVQQETGVSHGFVEKTRNEVKDSIPEPKMGRPTKVTRRTRSALAIKEQEGEFRHLRDAQAYIKKLDKVPVCKRTVTRYFKAVGLTARRKPDAPSLTDEQMRKRLEFARDHVKWTLDDWKNVMFSDECSFMRVKPFGTQYYYANDEHNLRHKHQFKQKMQGGGGRIMVWGCITAHGVGDLCWVEGTMDAKYYKTVLRDYVVDSCDWSGIDPAKFIFQQDNASIHTAKVVKEYIRDKNINVLVWPPNSSDISPIERLWAYIKQRLDGYELSPKTLQELFDRVEEIWMSVAKDYLLSLYAEMPSKMRMLIKTRGLHSKVPRGTGRRQANQEVQN